MATTSEYATADLAPQASTASFVIVAGSVLSVLRFSTLSYTIQNTGANSINWKVVAGSLQDLSDGVIVSASATILAGAFSSYAGSVIPYRYYGIYIIDTVGASHGEATVYLTAKK